MKVTIDILPAKLLTSLLLAPGWAKTLPDIYAGGKFLSELGETIEAPIEIEVTDKYLECVKKALKFHSEAGTIPASPIFVQLLDLLKIQPL